MRKLSLCVCLILFLLASSGIHAGDGQDTELKKKYADILGKWELDLTDAGMGLLPVEIYVDNGSFFAIPGEDPPLRMVRVEGSEWKFDVDDGDSIWGLEFKKDEKGKYHTCRITNDTEGIDSGGVKIKQLPSKSLGV
jgi:hypothetical protein